MKSYTTKPRKGVTEKQAALVLFLQISRKMKTCIPVSDTCTYRPYILRIICRFRRHYSKLWMRPSQSQSPEQ